MYKLLLCLRYLRTRYLAFVCIVSVMLGVATLIVVNSVMSGFSTKLKDRLRGISADASVDTSRADGFEEKPAVMAARIAASPVGQYVEAVSPTVEVYALLQFSLRARDGRQVPFTKHVKLIGVDPEKHAKVGRFGDYLVDQKGSRKPSFELTADATRRFHWKMAEALFDPEALLRPAGGDGGAFLRGPEVVAPQAAGIPAPVVPAGPPPRIPGAIIGHSIALYRDTDTNGMPEERQLLQPGDEITLATIGAGSMKPVSATFAVADYFKSDMSEYDGGFVYVHLDDLQRLRGMDGRVNSLQLRLTDAVRNDSATVHDVVIPGLNRLFPPGEAEAKSWEQHQGSLLAAIDIERGILNILLFLIVGVAGFSVLAIFTMIVGEKVRDIGVLKSLGASDRGVMTIFLGYGLLLGVIGCVLGTAAGLLITEFINEIEAGLSALSGRQIFDRKIYYFDRIPTNVEGAAVALVNAGAAGTAVLFSVLPAWRAARLHPVKALRFE